MQPLEESVFEFVADFTGCKRERLQLTTTLYGDLGVAGDDGLELIQAYGKKFQVSLTAFQSERYFGSEGVSIMAPLCILWLLLSHPFRRRQSPEGESKLQAVRIRDLIAFARAGQWVS